MGRLHEGGMARGDDRPAGVRLTGCRAAAHRAMGRAHAELVAVRHRLAGERGQGTVEYVALIILMALLLAAVVSAVKAKGDAGIATTIVDKLKDSIDGVGDPPRGR